VCRVDDEVDEINREMIHSMHNVMRQHPERLEAAVCMMSVSRHLERIADQSTNIAEDVIFMVEGEIVRHGL
jgi:phosphate transport system protein